jgi:hypothetical protein
MNTRPQLYALLTFGGGLCYETVVTADEFVGSPDLLAKIDAAARADDGWSPPIPGRWALVGPSDYEFMFECYLERVAQETPEITDTERIAQLEQALAELLPVAQETCDRWPNDDCFLIPVAKARATLAGLAG